MWYCHITRISQIDSFVGQENISLNFMVKGKLLTNKCIEIPGT